MAEHLPLNTYLDMAVLQTPALADVGQAVRRLAEAGGEISALLAKGQLGGSLSTVLGASRDGDGQKEFDLRTHNIVRDALIGAPVMFFASEEADVAELLNPVGTLAVAVDPLDGSSNIDTLAPIGTIFSILPSACADGQKPDPTNPLAAFLQPGSRQLAAGFLIYGPQTAMVLTLGEGTRIFTLDPQSGAYISATDPVAIAPKTREYAINGSNFRHWDQAIRTYVIEMMGGVDGPRGENFNTRWLASMVGDAFRILLRGGIYIYPGDERRGYREGRLRLIYEANPIAFIMEQAGGAATNGRERILDLMPRELHQRCPLVFGSSEEVKYLASCYQTSEKSGSPLFKNRSMFGGSASALEGLSCL
jgi:fructose-1,6-bisphosphatase I